MCMRGRDRGKKIEGQRETKEEGKGKQRLTLQKDRENEKGRERRPACLCGKRGRLEVGRACL